MTRNTRTLIGVLTVLAITAALGTAPATAQEKLLRLRVDGPLMEAPSDAAGLQALFANDLPQTLHEWVHDVRSAAHDPDIAGLALIIEAPVLSLAQIEEMTRAIHEFKDRGKPTFCYLDVAANGGFALAAAADHITVAEHTDLFIMGLQANLLYYKGLLDKIDAKMQGMHCGAYKNALEPFTRHTPSAETEEMLNWLLDGVYERWIELIAGGRGLASADVRRLVDQAPISAAEALEARLIDDVSSFEAFAQHMHKEFGEDVVVLKEYRSGGVEQVDWENPFAVFEFFGRLMEDVAEPEAPGIGLVYVEGGIMVGENDSSPFGGTVAGSTSIRAALDRAAEDDKIKAVVMRVDSPGGSAIASDIIWKAATRVAKKKPLIVTMGSVAGSGGYYVSLPGDVVFAEATTLTGSIGVVAGKLVLAGTFEDKLGINVTSYARGKSAGLFSQMEPWDDHEQAQLREFMERVYGQFKDRVRASRGARLVGELDDMAGGRVYTGRQALERGLVDRIGGLADALTLAREKAGLPRDCEVYVLPKPSEIQELFAMLKALEGGDGRDEFEISLLSRVRASGLVQTLPVLRQFAPAEFEQVVQALHNLLVLQREHVGCFMPAVPRMN